MYLKNVTRSLVAAMTAAMIVVMFLPARPVEADGVSKAQQILFFDSVYEMTKEAAAAHGMSGTEDLAMAQFCWESHYGTNSFKRLYCNISGVGCWPDSSGGPVVCHEIGRYSSIEECINAYYDLLVTYGFQGWTNSKAIVERMGSKYSGHSPNYVNNINGMIDKMRVMAADYDARAEAAAEAARKAEEERKAQMMAELSEETIMIIDAKAKQNPKVAGATAAMNLSTKEITVAKAAQKLIKGKFGDAEERRFILGANYDKVQEYREYISLPGQT